MAKAIHTWSQIAVNDPALGGGVTFSPFELFEQPDDNTIDLDNDGVMVPSHAAVVDLSHMGSIITGRQLPMNANYRVKAIRISLQNSDDGTDNSDTNYFGGLIRYWKPTSHLVDCMKTHRKIERHNETDQVDADSIFLPQGPSDYKGYRFGYYRQGDVLHPTEQEWGGVTYGNSIRESVARYETHLGGVGPEAKPSQLWRSRCGAESSMAWSTESSPVGSGGTGPTGISASHRIFEWHAGDGEYMDVLGGLLSILVTDSSTDQDGVTDDDFFLRVDVEVEGWSTW